MPAFLPVFALWAAGWSLSNTVTVSQPSALEEFSSAGQVVNIREAFPGEKFCFASFDGRYLIVTDGAGTRCRIAQAATDYSTAPNTFGDLRGGPVTPEQIRAITPRGVASFQALLADRPALLTLMEREDDVWTWLQVHFSNDGWTIRWSNDTSELSHYIAGHRYAQDNHPVLFLSARDASGKPRSPELQLSGVVYELLNATHEYEFNDVEARASRGEVSREQYILETAKIEFATCHEAQDFYREVWVAHVLREHRRLSDGDWHLPVGDNFAQWIDYHRRVLRDGYPDDAYGPYYTRIMAHRQAVEKGRVVSLGGG